MYGSTLLALRGGGCQISSKNRYITLEWPQIDLTKKNIDTKNTAWKKWNGILNIWNGKKTEFVKSETVKNGISKSWNGIYTILKRKNRRL